jgi:hypothetical protein
MSSQRPEDRGDKLVRYERRGLWLCLVVIVILGVVALLAGISSDATNIRYAQRLMALVPMIIIFGAVWVSRLQHSANSAGLKEHQRVMLNDELRLVATQHAFRAGFLAMIGAQALFCLLSLAIAFSWPAELVAATAIALGTAVFIGVFLFYDRA